jgi:hypothetical protein
MIRQYMGLLTAQAAAGSDPELYAGLILDQLDDDALNSLLDRKPDPVSALMADYPPAEAHREWFAQLVGMIESAMAEDPAEGNAEDPGMVIDLDDPNATIDSHASGQAAPISSGGDSVG